MAQKAQDFDQLHQELSEHLTIGRQRLLMKLASLNLQQRIQIEKQVRLRKSIKEFVLRKGGDFQKIGFSFERKGIFLERGVGKRRPVGSAKAQAAARPWLEPVLDPFVDEIADIIANGYADIVQGRLRLLIPGIIDKTA